MAWLSVWSEVQTCIWPNRCRCYSLPLASAKSRFVLPFWYRLKGKRAVKCVCVCVCVCVSKRPQCGPVRRYKDTVKTNMKRCGPRPKSLSTAPFDRAQWRTTCQSATASFEESRVAELVRKRAARKQQVINTTGTVWPCDRCSRTCSSRIGLVAHRRPHPSVTQSAVFDGALHVCVCVRV